LLCVYAKLLLCLHARFLEIRLFLHESITFATPFPSFLRSLAKLLYLKPYLSTTFIVSCCSFNVYYIDVWINHISSTYIDNPTSTCVDWSLL